MKWWTWLAGLAGVTLAGVGLLRTLPGLPVSWIGGSAQRQVLTAGAPPLSLSQAAVGAQDDKRQTILILGVDERADDAGRSDTMMVTALDPDGKDLPLVSLPRDTWVSIPGNGWDKISHAYAYGREPLAMQAVQELLDLPIDHYVVVNFQGFKAIVDAVGGVDINVGQPMDYDDPYDGDSGLHIHFRPGLQHLDGQKALEYARFRSDELGDLGRIGRQQALLKATLDRALRPEMVLRLPALARAMAQTVRTDLSVAQLVKLASQAHALSGAPTVASVVLTPSGERYFHGVFYSIVDRVVARAAAYRALAGGEPPADYRARSRAAESSLQEALAHEDGLARMAAAATVPAVSDRVASLPALGGRVRPSPDPDLPPVAVGSGRGAVALPGSSPSGPATDGSGPSDPSESSPVRDGAKAGADGGGQSPNVQPGAKPRPRSLTVALVNLSGNPTQARWFTLLRGNGFRVVTVSRGNRSIPKTTIVDRSGGDTELLSTLKRLFPGARVAEAPRNGEFAAEVHMGQDAVGDRSPW